MAKNSFSEYCRPKGTFDLYPISPEDEKNAWQNSAFWSSLESLIREHLDLYHFSEVRTPIFEKKALFCRGIGQGTDIVSKEMYVFEDRKGRELCLRPEGTAALVRAFIELGLDQSPPPHRYFYIGPMFRYERQQRGRYRQHHQMGVEVLGEASSEVDAELISMIHELYRRCGLKGVEIELNTLGNTEDRKRYRDALVAYLTPFSKDLSKDSIERLQVNPLRILDSKDSKDREILENAPKLEEYLSQQSLEKFKTVTTILEQLDVPYKKNSLLVRGLDYYCETVFEITVPSGAAQNSLGGGGRYDGLIAELGGPKIPGVGFATGLERVIQALMDQSISPFKKKRLDLLFIPLGDIARRKSLEISHKLRRQGISTDILYHERKMKQMLTLAEKINPRHITILGEEEISSANLKLKNWDTREEQSFAFTDIEKIKEYL